MHHDIVSPLEGQHERSNSFLIVTPGSDALALVNLFLNLDV